MLCGVTLRITIENGIKLFVAIMMLIFVLLTQFIHPGAVWFTVFTGGNLI